MCEKMCIRERANAHILSLGLTITLPDPMMIEMAYRVGFDFVRIDMEHRLFGDRLILEMLNTARLLDFPCQIRVPNMGNVTALLGHDAAGIVMPHCCSAEEARKAVDICKYTPIGNRGMDGACRRVKYNGMNRLDYMTWANDKTDLIVQIESREGIEHIDEILEIDGIDMIATGRSDLSQEFGIPGQRDDPRVIEAEDYIITKTLQYGKVPSLSCNTLERANELMKKGVYTLLIGKDEALAMKAMEQLQDKYRKNLVG